MLEIVIKIDCEKTEKSLDALCTLTGKSPQEQIKGLFNINEDLINIANEMTIDHQNSIKDMFGETVLNNLMGILL